MRVKGSKVSRPVFISHASEDREIAETICHYLESNDVGCWVAPRDIWPGEIWADAIINGINRAALFVVLCSQPSVRSSQVLREIERAAAKKIAIMPVRLHDVPLSGAYEYFLGNAHWMDLFPGRPESHLPKLGRAVTAHLGAPFAGVEVAAQSRSETVPHPDDWDRGRRGGVFSRLARIFDDRDR